MLELKNLSFAYEPSAPVLRDISYVFHRRHYAIIGPSGCGKSTLLRLLARLLLPTSGQISAASTSVVFQSPRLLGWKNVLQNVQFARASAKEAARLLQLCGLSEHAHKFPHQLSGGQAARVAFARALANKSEYLLLDEPFSSLDFFTAERLRSELKRWLEEQKTSLILITHNIDEALFLADEILLLKNGELISTNSQDKGEILNFFKETV